MPNIRRVVLDANRFRNAINLNVGVETELLVDTRLQNGTIAVVGEDHCQEFAGVPVPCGDDALRHPEQLPHCRDVVTVQAEQEAVGAGNVLGSLPDRLTHQPFRPRRPFELRLLGNIVKAKDDAGLIDDEPVATDDVPDTGIVDLVKCAYLSHGLQEGGGEATHVANHHLDAGLVARPDNCLRFGEGQTHWFLDEDVLARSRRRDGAVGVVFVAVEDEYGIEIGPPHQVEGVLVTIGILYPISVPDCSQQPGGNVTDGLDPKSVAEGLQDREMDDLRDLAEPDNSDTNPLHWPSPHRPCHSEPAPSISMSA